VTVKLFGSFFVIFLVIFSGVLVMTGEWDNRVEPALRRVIVHRVFGIDEAALEEADGDEQAAAADSVRTFAEEILISQGIEDESGDLTLVIEAMEEVYTAALADAQSEHETTVRGMREQLTDMSMRIGALEAQLNLLRTARKEGEADAWRMLGKVFASMRAEEASRIITHLPENQAVQLLSSMNPRNSAELIGKLDPGRAARLSGRLSAHWRDLEAEANLQ
jgi:flagellar motility protein MotE (MotC chaperone)